MLDYPLEELHWLSELHQEFDDAEGLMLVHFGEGPDEGLDLEVVCVDVQLP